MSLVRGFVSGVAVAVHDRRSCRVAAPLLMAILVCRCRRPTPCSHYCGVSPPSRSGRGPFWLDFFCSDSWWLLEVWGLLLGSLSWIESKPDVCENGWYAVVVGAESVCFLFLAFIRFAQAVRWALDLNFEFIRLHSLHWPGIIIRLDFTDCPGVWQVTSPTPASCT